jgi:UDP-3-O-[3-hydroxymyristoyl] glucosamine N-acyltransferase
VFSLGELADRLDLAFSGDGSRKLTGLASLQAAGPGDITFFSERKFLSQLAATRAGAVILAQDYVEEAPADCLISPNPYLTFARVSRLFDPSPRVEPGLHPTAVVAPDAQVHESASIAAQVVVESGARVGAGVSLGAGVYLGHNSLVGDGSHIHPQVVIYHDVHIGRDCIIHSQSVIGADGFGFAPGPEGWEKIVQSGGVRIGDRVEIGACTSVDRGTLEHTVIADGVIIDNQVQIAHNCRIGKNTAIAGCAGLAGSTIIGANCTLAGGVGVVGHVEICDNVHVTGMTMVTRSITRPGSYSSGTPMTATGEWKRNAVRFSQLDALQQRLANLEKQRR